MPTAERLTDRHATLRDLVFARVLDGAGETEPMMRHAAAADRGLPPELQPLVDKVHTHAYRVTDGDISTLKGRYTDDQLFEIIVSAALGASRKRLAAGLGALDQALKWR